MTLFQVKQMEYYNIRKTQFQGVIQPLRGHLVYEKNPIPRSGSTSQGTFGIW